MPDHGVRVEIADGIARTTPDDWDRLAGDHPFLRHAFLSALEDSGAVGPGTGWQPAHLLIRGTGGLRGAMPCYLKSHSLGEYVFDHGWAETYEQAGGRYYPKLLGAIPFTPVTGPRLLAAPGEDRAKIARLLIAAARRQAEDMRLSSFHITFLEEAEAALAEANGLLIRHDIQFHWRNRNFSDFEDFLASLSARKRKQIRRERREAQAADIVIERLPGEVLSAADWDSYYRFYLDTSSRKWGRPYLNRMFFALIAERMPDALLMVRCREEDRPIAGALNFLSSRRIYGRWWGAVVERPFLHFEACYYQAIEHAIACGLAWVEAGAQGPHKLLRGYEPVRTRSAHHIVEPRFREAVARFLARERHEMERSGDRLSRHLPYRRDQKAGRRPMPE
ncbi:MAG: GNAT family N-acetyltransferase [Rhodothalassiaceae bacterium]